MWILSNFHCTFSSVFESSDYAKLALKSGKQPQECRAQEARCLRQMGSDWIPGPDSPGRSILWHQQVQGGGGRCGAHSKGADKTLGFRPNSIIAGSTVSKTQ